MTLATEPVEMDKCTWKNIKEENWRKMYLCWLANVDQIQSGNSFHVSGSPLHWTAAALFRHPLADPDLQADLNPLPHHARPPHRHQEAARLCLHPQGVEGVGRHATSQQEDRDPWPWAVNWGEGWRGGAWARRSSYPTPILEQRQLYLWLYVFNQSVPLSCTINWRVWGIEAKSTLLCFCHHLPLQCNFKCRKDSSSWWSWNGAWLRWFKCNPYQNEGGWLLAWFCTF